MLNNYSKENIKKCLFTEEIYFEPDGIHNSQNDRVWAPSREEADRKGGFHKKSKHPGKVMVLLGACAKGLTTPVIFENETMNAEVYIIEVLPIVLECGDKMFGSNWTYQEDSARSHIHHLTQEWCAKHFPDFISKKLWPLNSSDLCPLDYSLWNELAQCMNWNQIRAKIMLIEGIKRFITKVGRKRLLNSILNFTIRLREIKRNGGNYIY